MRERGRRKYRSRNVRRCGQVQRAEGTAEIDVGYRKRETANELVETNRLTADPGEENESGNIARNQCEPVTHPVRERGHTGTRQC